MSAQLRGLLTRVVAAFDGAGILATMGEELDRGHTDRWVGELDPIEEWRAAQSGATR